MSRGSRDTLTGTLRRAGRGYALETEDGGIWRLDVAPEWNPKARVGCRVTVEGVRLGSDLLDVHRLYIAS